MTEDAARPPLPGAAPPDGPPPPPPPGPAPTTPADQTAPPAAGPTAAAFTGDAGADRPGSTTGSADPPPGASAAGSAEPPPAAGATPGGHPPPGYAPPPGGAGFTSRYGLVRPREGRYLAGVCAAIGRATNTDPVLWRVLLAVLGFFGGIGVLIYVAAWLIIPGEGDTASPVESMLGRGRSSMSPVTVIVLSILVAVSFGYIVTDAFRAVLLGAAILIGGALLLNRDHRAPAGPQGPPGPPPAPPGPVPPASWPAPGLFTPPAGAGAPAGAPTSGLARQAGPATPAGGPTAAAWEPSAGPATGERTAAGHPAGAAAEPPAWSGAGQTGVLPAPPGAEPTTELPAWSGTQRADEESAWSTPESRAEAAGWPPASTTGAVPSVPPASPVTAPLPPGGYRAPFAPRGPYAGPYPPAQPPAPAAKAPKRPKERSPLGAVTFSLIFLALGVVAVLDLLDVFPVGAAGYFAAALATIGLGLLVGTWFGRARWLIALGLVTAAALGVATVAESYDRVRGVDGNVTWAPTDYRDLAVRYENNFGDAVLDLRAVDFDKKDTQITVAVNFGEATVVVPPNVDVTTVADVNAGDATVFGRRSGGLHGRQRESTDLGPDGPGGGTLRLLIHVNAGNLEVTR
ncbi:phage shock protein C (PspC) family protein [Micromonospora rhizosphaerae]|uniref:Phage shock protein C (PspC) family protein n=1 Tax=Micromonospora rhizosphaerae TaxID=568872 RepID=A0A1C6TE17_9ACTN|nr:PspC domain-containing protein [Micromonospora rhizosphaerae]SCL40056.1 phage shock protein C (PspC) family protein [Micromonospora rhizosphaerae]SCL41865.1 phage shock protein C (PspC) family protein [Micromonospora rhizosphaerae]